jgi:hypothetical protein
MDRYIDIHEAFHILRKHYVTESMQMVGRWLRAGKIHGERTANRKEGWRISENDLYEFIDEMKPGIAEIVAFHEEHIEEKVMESHDRKYEEEYELESIEEEEEAIEVQQNNQEIKDNDETKLHKSLDLLINLNQNMSKQINELISVSKEVIESNREYVEKKSIEENIHYHKTFDKFLKELEEDFTNEEISKYEARLKGIYNAYYCENTLKDEVYTEEGTFKCPLTQEEEPQFKRLVKSVVSNYITKTDADT